MTGMKNGTLGNSSLADIRDLFNTTNTPEIENDTSYSLPYCSELVQNLTQAIADRNTSFFVNGTDYINKNASLPDCIEDYEYYYYYETEPVLYLFDVTYIRWIFIFLYGLVFAFCFFGNLMVLLVILKHPKMRTITNFFLGNLAFSDLCVGIFCVLPNLSLYLSPYWYLGRVMCKAYFFVQAMCYTASITILTVISMERFIALNFPMKAKSIITMCSLRITVIIVWLLAACAGSPYLYFYDQVTLELPDSKISFCIIVHQFNSKAFITINFVLGYIVPLSLMIVLYSKIAYVLWKSSKSGIATSSNASKKTKGHKGGTAMKGNNFLFKRKPTIQKDKPKLLCYNTKKVDDTVASEHQKPVFLAKQIPVITISAAVDSKRDDLILAEGGYENEALDLESGPVLNNQNIKANKSHNNSGNTKKTNKTSKKEQSTSNILRDPAPNAKKQVDKTASNQKPKLDKALVARRKVIRLLVSVVVSFAVCMLPYHIRVLWQTWKQPVFSFYTFLFPPITFLIFYANSGLNPLLYAFLSDNFRKCLFEVMTCNTKPDNRFASKSTSHANI